MDKSFLLIVENIKGGSQDDAFVDRLNECSFINTLSSRHIDQSTSTLHRIERLFVYDVVGRSAVRASDEHAIRKLEH